jgi:hypothetical protein
MSVLAAPTVDGQVSLSLPHRETVPGHVETAGDGWVDLALHASPSTPLAVLERAELFLEFRGADGAAYVVLGAVTATPGAHIAGPLAPVHALRFHFRGAPEKVFRRAYVRTDYVARVFLTLPAAPERPGPCVTMNVSGGGLLLRGVPGDAPADADVAFVLDLGASMPRVTGSCRIVRRTPEGFIGVQFSEIADADRDRLVAFAEQRERVSRASRGGY